MNVLVALDTEIRCYGWENINRSFRMHLKHIFMVPQGLGITACLFYFVYYPISVYRWFFVEVLFPLRFGKKPLEEIVGLILKAGQRD